MGQAWQQVQLYPTLYCHRLVTWTLLYARQLGNTVKCASKEKTKTEEQAGFPPTTRCLKFPGVLQCQTDEN